MIVVIVVTVIIIIIAIMIFFTESSGSRGMSGGVVRVIRMGVAVVVSSVG